MAKQVRVSGFANEVKLVAGGSQDRQDCEVENESSTSRYCCQLYTDRMTYEGTVV
jgi:hypothetical protein